MVDETKVSWNITGPIFMVGEERQGIQLSEVCKKYVSRYLKGGDYKGILNNVK